MERIIEAFRRGSNILAFCARRTGRTRAIAQMAAEYVLGDTARRVVIVTPTIHQSRPLSNEIRFLITDSFLQVARNEEFILNNDSTIRIISGHHENALRGLSADVIFLDDADYVCDEIVRMAPFIARQAVMMSVPSPNPESAMKLEYNGLTKIDLSVSDEEDVSTNWETFRIPNLMMPEMESELPEAYRLEFLCEF